MGYHIETEIIDLVITDKIGALNAINSLHTDKGMDENHPRGGSSNGDRFYSWVDTPPKGGFKTLEKALEAWNFEYEVLVGDGSIKITYDTCEKQGDQEVFYETIAPYVHEDSEVICYGEDDSVWRHLFCNGAMTQEYGRKEIVWDS
jgi:hypothetical protein